jgi:hypothetical protein
MVKWKPGFVHVNEPTIARQLGVSGVLTLVRCRYRVMLMRNSPVTVDVA